MAVTGTVAGRPQPQTTAEPAGGPFVRHSPGGRRAMYVAAPGTTANAQFIANPMVSSPGWNRGYNVLVNATAGTSTTVGTANADAPWNYFNLVQMKDAFGTQLLTGPGYDIAYLVPLYSGVYGLRGMASLQNSPQFNPLLVPGSAGSQGSFQFSTFLPFEFAKAYGLISGANAALLPVLQINTNTNATLFSSAVYSASPSVGTVTVDSSFYWLPNVAADPPGIGTTQQFIYQPCNPPIASSAAQFVQLPRLGGYLTCIIFDLRDANGVRVTETNATTNYGWPSRPRFVIDGVPITDTLFTTWQEDLAIAQSIGTLTGSAATSTGTTNTGTAGVARPSGTFGLTYKGCLSQESMGLFDTGETWPSTNPGTQIEVGGFPWGAITTGPGQLNVVAGQVVPSGALVRGLPEA